jgi:hypothetical protein
MNPYKSVISILCKTLAAFDGTFPTIPFLNLATLARKYDNDFPIVGLSMAEYSVQRYTLCRFGT